MAAHVLEQNMNNQTITCDHCGDGLVVAADSHSDNTLHGLVLSVARTEGATHACLHCAARMLVEDGAAVQTWV